MLKRLFAIGAAFALAFSLSLSSFASTSDILSIGFPLYGHTRVRQGGSQIYLSSNGSVPISSDSSLSLNGSGGTVIFDFFPMDHFFFHETDINYIDIPVYEFHSQFEDDLYLYFHSPSDSGYQSVDNPLCDFGAEVTYIRETIDLGQWSNIDCNSIESGQYVLEGTLVFSSGAIGSVDAWNSMISGLTATVVDSDSNSYPIGMTSPVFDYFTRGNNDFINFRLCLDIPYSGVYQRLFFQLTSKTSGGIPSLKGFFVNTGSIKFQSATNTQSLSILLGTWFDKLIGTIKGNSVSDDDNASRAAAEADNQSVSQAQSGIQQVEAFESSLNSSIGASVNQIDFTLPTNFGQALGAVGYIFTSCFNALGGYQIVITIPLILGIMLILIGRGTLALGRVISANAAADRRASAREAQRAFNAKLMNKLGGGG